MIRFAKAKTTSKKPTQSNGKKVTLNKLKSFLTAAEPEVVEILLSNWNAQSSSVTYKELREAYLAGGLSEKQFQKWQKDYAKLINSTLAVKWQQAAAAAAQEVMAKYPYFVYEPAVSASMGFIKQHGAELVTNLAKEQREALNALIAHCSGYTAISPDEAARIMRPCIGLTKPQALANARYRESVKAAYLNAHPHGKAATAEKKAAEAAARYAARQHRYRAQSIARTELAYAYNVGAYGATKDAQAKGYIGACVKIWLTAYDERVCPICSQLDDEKHNLEVAFSNGKMLPPAHPQCRCAVAYEEAPAGNLYPVLQSDIIDTQAPQSLPPASVSEPAAPMPALKPAGGYNMTDVMDDLNLLPQNLHGAAIRSDGGMLEGLNLTGRRITIGGAEYYEFSGKLMAKAWEAIAKNAKKRGLSSKMQFLARNADGTYNIGNVGMELSAHRITTLDHSVFEVYADYINKEQYSMGGFFRIRVPATGNMAADRKAMEQIFDKAGLRALTANPTNAEELLLKKSRIAWRRNPQAMGGLEGASAAQRSAKIDQILRQEGITEARVQSMKLREVFPGYSTYVDEAAGMEYRKLGLTHIWAGVDSADNVVAICQSDGFAATNYRITAGMKKCGASPGADMASGGADSVFTRIGVNTKDRYAHSYLGGQYRVIIAPDELNRTDWYAYEYDNYGNARMDGGFKNRKSSLDFVKSMGKKDGYDCSNEIMFRHGISTDKFLGISCETAGGRNFLIQKFRDAGITKFNGVPIEEFVTVTTRVGDDSIRGIQGLSYYNNDNLF